MIIGNNVVLIVTFIFAIAFPAALLIWWKKHTGESIWSFAAGAICFVLFAMVLENLLHQVCLGQNNAISAKRLFGFKVLLRRKNDYSCAVAYGIGHGGIEVILILGVSYLTMLLAIAGVNVGDAATTALIAANAQSITMAGAGIAMFERISAMMIHVGLSMLVFTAARSRKSFWLYPVAIVLHAIADVPAALYQYKAVSSLAMVEGGAFAIGLICLLAGIRALRRGEA